MGFFVINIPFLKIPGDSLDHVPDKTGPLVVGSRSPSGAYVNKVSSTEVIWAALLPAVAPQELQLHPWGCPVSDGAETDLKSLVPPASPPRDGAAAFCHAQLRIWRTRWHILLARVFMAPASSWLGPWRLLHVLNEPWCRKAM